MNSQPAAAERRVTAIIPVFNREAFLPACLDSVLAQTYPHIEVIVIDDGSIDGTPGVLARYGDRIRVLRQENAGPYVARNRGIAESRGELVTFIDSDDRIAPQKIARQVTHLAAHPAAVLVYTHVAYRDVSGRRWVPREQSMLRGDLAREMVRSFGAQIPWPTALVRRAALERTGAFDTRHRVAMDRELGIRLAQLGPFELIPAPLYEYRLHPDQISQDLEPREAAARYILGRLAHVAPHGNDHRLLTAAEAQMHLQLARLAYIRGVDDRARQHLAAALRADPALARDRSVQLLRVKSRLGRGAVRRIGRLVGRRAGGWSGPRRA
ncbi:MAG: glycosyltransferase, partial [Candidatus Eisenbacteria bacterium]|nr:glycosyltransferase [Candidatus Eisenbacteria bacterium]